MSILIKGMEMPTSCDKCIYSAWSNFYQIYVCNAVRNNEPVLFDGKQTKSTAVARSARADNCPLVPVPPHGRLVDADALASEMEKQIKKQDELMELCKSAGDTKNYFNTSKVQIGMVSFLRALNNAPTIIPVDKEEVEA